MSKLNRVLFGAAAVCVVFGIAGCQNMEDYRNERAEKAIRHFEAAKYRELLEGQRLSLRECVDLAQRNNLDLQVNKLEEKVAREMKTSEMLGMLPELTVGDNLTSRSNQAASSSEQIHGTGAGTYSYSRSQDRGVNYFNVDLALSVIDFGLAFFNTQQAQDRVYMRQMRTLRASQNLTLEVVRAYFSVAAAQRAIKITNSLLDGCKSNYERIKKLGENGQIDPFRAFDEVRQFVEMEKRLKNYVRSYENSCVELRSLLGMHPSGRILVEDSYLSKVPEYELPDIELMEQIALLKRPELYEIDIQKHINLLEVRKEIVQMFPNVRVVADFTNSSNTFLYHASWYELGIRAAYNLLKIPVHVAKAMGHMDQVKAEEHRSFAQAIAVMAQVRIAHANLKATQDRYAIDAELFKNFNEHLERASRTARSGELSKLQLDHIKLRTAETEIERLMTLGNYYVAYFRMLNAIGISSVSVKDLGEVRKELEAAKVRAREELDSARAEFETRLARIKAAPVDSQMRTVEGKMADRPITNFGTVDFISIYEATPGTGVKIGTGAKR